MRPSHVFSLSVTALLLGGVGLGCSDTNAPGHGRYVHRFFPKTDEWTRESKLPKKPPKKPSMWIWEFSDFPPDTEPTAEQQAAAKEMIERCHEAAIRHGWDDVNQAIADNFILPPQDNNHYRNDDYRRDDQILDPDHPEFLMYYPLDGEAKLAGFMFYTRSYEEHGPQFGGPLTLWHYHTWRDPHCVPWDLATVTGKCLEGEPSYRTPEMIHVWLVDRPEGPFATSMLILPEILEAGMKKRMQERGY